MKNFWALLLVCCATVVVAGCSDGSQEASETVTISEQEAQMTDSYAKSQQEAAK